jgi:FkbM family methyltransferase
MYNSSMQAFFFHDFKNAYIPHILKEIYLDRVYDRFLLGKKDLTIFDIGGNIGLTSYFFKDFAKQVYCVEPAKQHIECINKLVEFNNIDNITVLPYALAAQDGTTKFYHNPNSTMFSMNPTVNNQKDYEEVETMTLETLMQKVTIDHIDVMKLDVEGSEGEIIVSDGFTKVADKIDVIVGEWHTWSSMNQHMFANTFRDLGFTFNWYNNTDAYVFSAVRL